MKKSKIRFTYLGSSSGYLGKNEKPSVIYTVTSIQGDPKRSRTRCWGWYPTLEEAIESVKMNAGDMAECCYYSHVVIEVVSCGIPSIPSDKEHWFKWKVDPKDKHGFNGQWHKCSKPAWSIGFKGWSLG